MPASTVKGVFRRTPQRTAILDVVRRSDDHPTARDIYRRVRRDLPGVGVATVYRALDLLRDHGQILELQLADSPVTRYDANTGPHHHVLCSGCGAVADVHVDLPTWVARAAERTSGFQVTATDLQFTGRCPSCHRPPGSPTATGSRQPPVDGLRAELG